jgi:hypothetical protein
LARASLSEILQSRDWPNSKIPTDTGPLLPSVSARRGNCGRPPREEDPPAKLPWDGDQFGRTPTSARREYQYRNVKPDPQPKLAPLFTYRRLKNSSVWGFRYLVTATLRAPTVSRAPFKRSSSSVTGQGKAVGICFFTSRLGAFERFQPRFNRPDSVADFSEGQNRLLLSNFVTLLDFRDQMFNPSDLRAWHEPSPAEFDSRISAMRGPGSRQCSWRKGDSANH